MKKLKLIFTLVASVFLSPAMMPVEGRASTVVVENTGSPDIKNSNYIATISDGTVLGFSVGGDEAWFCGAISNSHEIAVPDSIILKGENRTVAVKYCGYGVCDFDNAKSVVSLILPPTIEYIDFLAPTIKELHLNNYVSNTSSDQIENLDKVLVPEKDLLSYLDHWVWRKCVLICAEGAQPLKITVNMTKAGEFAQLLLQQVDNWYRVNELKVVGPLNENDLNVFKRMEQLTLLDLSDSVIEDIPDRFDGAYGYSGNREGFNLLETLILPEVNSIGECAFSQCPRLKNITMPKVNEIKYGAFAQCGARKIEFPDGLTAIGDWTFAYSKLDEIKIPATVTRIGAACFYYGQLSSISLPESLNEIRESTFYGSKLSSVDLSHIQKIGDQAFYECRELANVKFCEGLEDIGYVAFGYCESLANIDLPATLMNVNSEAFSNCKGIKSVTCRAVVPPTHNGGSPLLNYCDMTDVKLYVPAMSIDKYREAGGWKAFYTVLPMDEKISYMHIYDDVVIDDASIFSEDLSMVLDWQYQSRNGVWDNYVGRVDYNGQSTLSMDDFSQNYDLGYGEYDEYQSNQTRYTSLISNGSMRADKVHTALKTKTNDAWYFISLPYDVRVEDIGYKEGTQFAIRKYSGSNRANHSGDTWLNLTADSVMHAYEGYILRCNKSDAEFTLHALNNGNKNKVFEKESVVMELGEYLSEFEHNRSWNLIGNPYPCYYDTRYMDFTAPITVWNAYHQRYDAYSPLDDSYILHPAQAFFVQRPVAQAAITFNKAGRQKTQAVRDDAPRELILKAAASDARKVFNVILSDGVMTDRTRFVINSDATCEYELDKDASKFIAGDNRSLLLYTLENGLRYAINERPLSDGVVHLGFYAPAAGEYSMSLDSMYPDKVLLTDKMESEEQILTGEYRFNAKAGYNDMRFTLTLGGTTGIGSIISDDCESDESRCEVYTTDGRMVGTYTIAEVDNLPKGIYIVNGKDIKRKIVVK